MIPARPVSPARHSHHPANADAVGAQVYRWPSIVPVASGTAMTIGLLGLAVSLWLVLTSETINDAGRLSVGFVAAVFSGLAIIAGVIVLYVAACEVRFTIDQLEVRRLGRRTLRLAYSGYERDWIVDAGHEHVVRLIVMRGNTACSIYLPPDWLRGAFDEVARIQAEEGWYEPAF